MQEVEFNDGSVERKLIEAENEECLHGKCDHEHHHAIRRPNVRSVKTVFFKGSDRNKPCPCGSGLKFKKCCIGKI